MFVQILLRPIGLQLWPVLKCASGTCTPVLVEGTAEPQGGKKAAFKQTGRGTTGHGEINYPDGHPGYVTNCKEMGKKVLAIATSVCCEWEVRLEAAPGAALGAVVVRPAVAFRHCVSLQP